MAIQPIKRYGGFTATGIDTSGVKRMQALAGLGATAASVGTAIGEKIAEAQAPEEAQAKAEQALKEGTAPEKKSPFNYAYKTFNNQLVQGYAAGIQNKTNDMIARVAAENPADYSTFQKLVNEGYKGLSANLPVEVKATVDNFFSRSFAAAGNKIIKEQTKIATNNAKAEMAQAGINYHTEQSNLATEGLSAELAESIRDEDAAALAAGPDVVNYETYLKNKAKRMADYRQAGVLGSLRRDIINNPELDAKEKITRLNGAVAAIKEKTVLQVPDPEDPSKMVRLDEKERKSMISAVEAEVKDYKDLVKQQIAKNTLLDRIDSAENYMRISATAEDTEIDADQRLLSINTAEKDGLLRTEDASILRRYVKSEQAIDAKTNNEIYGDIVGRIYGLNADLSLQGNNADYIEGIRAIDEFIKEQRTVGALSRDDEVKLQREMRNLTEAKQAGAISELALSYTSANRIIIDNTPPELRNDVRARLFDRVQAEIRSAEEAGEPLGRGADRKLWKQYALSTATEVLEEERQRSQDSIRDVLSRTPVATPPAITTQAEYDALQSGDQYIFNGKLARKP